MTENRRLLEGELEVHWSKIKARIDRNGHLLGKQGSITSRRVSGRPSWLLRFVDSSQTPSVQRAIYLGADVEIVRRAQERLDYLRSRANWPKEAAVLARLVGKAAALLRRVRRGD